MASKRARTDRPSASCAPVRCNNPRFVGQKAEDFFYQYEGKNCAVEKGFNYDHMIIDDVVNRYHLHNLLSAPTNVGSSILVKEFYANAFERNGLRNKSKVRGRDVNYSRKTIMQYYNIPCDPYEATCNFLKLEQNMLSNVAANLNLILDTFGEFPEVDRRVTKGVVIKAKFLPFHLRCLHRLICERILPTSRFHEVHWRRAALMHVLVSMETIDLGSIIALEINRTFQNMSKINFVYPLLISGLIASAGVNVAGVVWDLACTETVTKKNIQDKSHPKGITRGHGGVEIRDEEEEGGQNMRYNVEDDLSGAEAYYDLSTQFEAMKANLTSCFTAFKARLDAQDRRYGDIERRLDDNDRRWQQWREDDLRFRNEMLSRLPPAGYQWPQGGYHSQSSQPPPPSPPQQQQPRQRGSYGYYDPHGPQF